MSLPNINFKKNDLEIGDDLTALVEQKLETLEKFIGDIPGVCDVEFEKVADQQQGKIYRVEINLQLGGKLYRAEATMENFEAAIDEVRDELDKELRREHDKRETLLKKGGRKLKEMLRFGREG